MAEHLLHPTVLAELSQCATTLDRAGVLVRIQQAVENDLHGLFEPHGGFGLFSQLPTEIVFAIADQAWMQRPREVPPMFRTCKRAAALQEPWAKAMYRRLGGMGRKSTKKRYPYTFLLMKAAVKILSAKFSTSLGPEELIPTLWTLWENCIMPPNCPQHIYDYEYFGPGYACKFLTVMYIKHYQQGEIKFLRSWLAHVSKWTSLPVLLFLKRPLEPFEFDSVMATLREPMPQKIRDRFIHQPYTTLSCENETLLRALLSCLLVPQAELPICKRVTEHCAQHADSKRNGIAGAATSCGSCLQWPVTQSEQWVLRNVEDEMRCLLQKAVESNNCAMTHVLLELCRQRQCSVGDTSAVTLVAALKAVYPRQHLRTKQRDGWKTQSAALCMFVKHVFTAQAPTFYLEDIEPMARIYDFSLHTAELEFLVACGLCNMRRNGKPKYDFPVWLLSHCRLPDEDLRVKLMKQVTVEELQRVFKLFGPSRSCSVLDLSNYPRCYLPGTLFWKADLTLNKRFEKNDKNNTTTFAHRVVKKFDFSL